jgi:aminopeptidase
MTDPRVDKLADLLVNYSVSVRPGDKVLVEGSSMAEPLLKAVFVEVLKAGGHPLMQVSLPGTDELLYRLASEAQLEHVPEPRKLAIETYDARIVAIAERNTKALTGADPNKMMLRSRSQGELLKTMLERSARGELRWVATLFPTDAHAQDAEMSLSDYEDFVYGACIPEDDDPVGYWRRFSQWQQGIIEWLKGKKRVRVAGPDTELSFSIEDRVFINCDGKMNMPDGEVFTGPVEDSMEGHVCFSYPAIYRGREVSGIRLRFEKGKVVEASAEKGEEILLQMLEADEGARRVGEFAIGTNPGIQHITREILFDEKINGSFHMALGKGYPESGSRNDSAIHWDMICDLRQGGRIWVDDELLYEDGRFVLDF